MKTFNKIAKFLEGIASAISLYPQENTRKINLPTSSVGTSLKNDWEKIGLDMWNAYRTIESQQLEAKHHGNNSNSLKKHPAQHL